MCGRWKSMSLHGFVVGCLDEEGLAKSKALARVTTDVTMLQIGR